MVCSPSADALWAGRDLYRATAAVTRELGFIGLVQGTAPSSRFITAVLLWPESTRYGKSDKRNRQDDIKSNNWRIFSNIVLFSCRTVALRKNFCWQTGETKFFFRRATVLQLSTILLRESRWVKIWRITWRLLSKLKQWRLKHLSYSRRIHF